MRRSPFTALSLVPLLVFVSAAQTVPPEPKLTPDDYAVFATVLNHEFKDMRFHEIVVLNETSTAVPPGAGVARQPGIKQAEFANSFTPELRERFDAANKTPAPLD